MNKHLLFGPLGVLFLSAAWASALGPTIEHRPVECATAGKFPKLEAVLGPAETIGAARVLFQGKTADWYSVSMKPEGGVFVGVLPKPNKDLKSFRYYIEATDSALGTNRTVEYTTAVVESAGACRGKLMAGSLSTASIVLQGPAGAASLPAGFAASGVVAGTSAGASAGTAAASAAGGGIGATALVVGGVAVAGGAAALVASKSSDEGSSSNSNQTIRLHVSILSSSTTATGQITTPFIDVSACRPSTTFGGGDINLRGDGTFDDTWNPPSEQVLRVTGRADANSLQANLSCVGGGGPTGSLAAGGSGYSLDGTFSFGPS